MPPRKSESTTPAAAAPPPLAPADATSPGSKAAQPQEKKDKTDKGDKSDKADKEPVTIEDLSLPKSIITRLAKGILPPNTQIQGNAILALSKSATVFISYLAAHANENTVAAGKKTLLPGDVFKALDDTEFGFLKERLEAEFAKFNAIQTEKRTNYRQKVKTTKPAGDDTEMADTTAMSDAAAASSSSSSGPRAAKKQRVDTSTITAAVGDGGETDEEPDAEVQDDDVVDEDEDEDEEEVQEEEEEEEEGEEEGGEGGGQASGDETQDALEERHRKEDADEALDGDESD
ncbi:DNA polymerase epsilon subunit D [Cladobotryum mycophilum]|uniref:DNA polymerase epsilon subunit D n=1 Tax=Cladobotryum mycophilum TaxID=491253 RepID=A0ABR0S5B1_9HYPO